MPPRISSSGQQPSDPDAFIERFPPAIRELANEARHCFRRALPEALERVYPGWELVGYRIPVRSGTRYVGFVAPRRDRVVVGFEYGVHLAERFPFLTGDGSQVRELVLMPGERAPAADVMEEVITAAAELAEARKGQRLART